MDSHSSHVSRNHHWPGPHRHSHTYSTTERTGNKRTYTGEQRWWWTWYGRSSRSYSWIGCTGSSYCCRRILLSPGSHVSTTRRPSVPRTYLEFSLIVLDGTAAAPNPAELPPPASSSCFLLLLL